MAALVVWRADVHQHLFAIQGKAPYRRPGPDDGQQLRGQALAKLCAVRMEHDIAKSVQLHELHAIYQGHAAQIGPHDLIIQVNDQQPHGVGLARGGRIVFYGAHHTNHLRLPRTSVDIGVYAAPQHRGGRGLGLLQQHPQAVDVYLRGAECFTHMKVLTAHRKNINRHQAFDTHVTIQHAPHLGAHFQAFKVVG